MSWFVTSSCRRHWKYHSLYVYSPVFFPSHNRSIDPRLVMSLWFTYICTCLHPSSVTGKKFSPKSSKNLFLSIGLNNSLINQKTTHCRSYVPSWLVAFSMFFHHFLFFGDVWEIPIHHGLRTFDRQFGCGSKLMKPISPNASLSMCQLSYIGNS